MSTMVAEMFDAEIVNADGPVCGQLPTRAVQGLIRPPAMIYISHDAERLLVPADGDWCQQDVPAIGLDVRLPGGNPWRAPAAGYRRWRCALAIQITQLDADGHRRIYRRGSSDWCAWLLRRRPHAPVIPWVRWWLLHRHGRQALEWCDRVPLHVVRSRLPYEVTI